MNHECALCISIIVYIRICRLTGRILYGWTLSRRSGNNDFFFRRTKIYGSCYIIILLSPVLMEQPGHMVRVSTPWIEPWHSRALYYRLARSFDVVPQWCCWVGLFACGEHGNNGHEKPFLPPRPIRPRRTRSPVVVGSAAAQQPTIASPARHRFSCPPTVGCRRTLMLVLRSLFARPTIIGPTVGVFTRSVVVETIILLLRVKRPHAKSIYV